VRLHGASPRCVSHEYYQQHSQPDPGFGSGWLCCCICRATDFRTGKQQGRIIDDEFSTPANQVSEPPAMLIFAMGLVGLAAYRCRRRN
jgi:hypothetical protein